MTFVVPLVYRASTVAVDPLFQLAAPSGSHPLGTDQLGRDQLARVLVGGQASLPIGFAASVIAVALGLCYGIAAGLGPRLVDALLMRLLDALLAVPTIVILLFLAALATLNNAILIILLGLTSWPRTARVVRNETLAARSRDFVTASRQFGAGTSWVARTHILRTILPIRWSTWYSWPPIMSWPSLPQLPGTGRAAAYPFLGKSALRRYAEHLLQRLVDDSSARSDDLPHGGGRQPDRRGCSHGDGAELMALLEVEDLRVQFHSRHGTVRAVDGVSFSLEAGEVVGLVGESGSGKSVTGLSLLRLLPKAARITGGRIRFAGRDLLTLSEREMRQIRGNQIAMVFQDPMTSLNPTVTVGNQIAESYYLHRGGSGRAALGRGPNCLTPSGCPMHGHGWATIPISSRAVCASA